MGDPAQGTFTKHLPPLAEKLKFQQVGYYYIKGSRRPTSYLPLRSESEIGWHYKRNIEKYKIVYMPLYFGAVM